MSLKINDIDLNADVVPVEANTEVYGATFLESTVRVDISAAETLMEPSSGEGGVRGFAIDGVIDEARVFGEAKGSAEGFHGVDERLRHEVVVGESGKERLEAEMECVDRGSDAKVGNVSPFRIRDDSKGKDGGDGGEIAVNDGGIDLGLRDGVSRIGFEVDENCWKASGVLNVDGHVENVSTRDEKEERVSWVDETPYVEVMPNSSSVTVSAEQLPDSHVGMEAKRVGNGEVEAKVEGDENRVMGVCDSIVGVPQHNGDGSNMISLIVDLSPRPGNEELMSGNEIGNKGIKEFSGDVDISFPDSLADNTTCCINGVGLNGNKDVVIKEQARDVGQQEHVDKKNVPLAALKPEWYGKECRIEKEGEFCVSDLVWGKVRSHPWWPGQIFDHSASSEKAKKYFKKDGYLIAYFGDQTFAWNDASRIRPFRMHFSQMEKQSNLEAFCHAVDCALDEVSRRVEFGLACPCLSEEVYDKIKSQVFVNAGIQEESSRRDGGDNFSSAASFIPAKFVQYLKGLAQAPYDGTDKLEFVTAKAQLLAFNSWKGYYQLPMLEVLNGLLENDADFPLLGKEKDPDDEVIKDAVLGSLGDEQVPYGKGKSIIQDSSSRKRKHISGDGLCPSKKERCISDLMSGSCSSLPNGENKSEKAGRKLMSLSSGKKRKAVDFISNGSRVKHGKCHLSPATVNKLPSRPKKLLRVGERIQRVASQLAESPPILKYDDKMSQKIVGNNGGKSGRSSFGVSPSSSEKSQKVKVIPAEYPPPDEMLSQLCLAARDPMKGFSFLISIVSFFSDVRNSFCTENSNSRKDKKLIGSVSGKQTGKKASNSKATETPGFEGMEDSYWTDRIIQSNPEKQDLFEPETPVEKGTPTVEPEAALDTSSISDYKQETAVVDPESEAEKPAGHMDEKCKEYSPTALILNFTDLDSVPSITNLNEIFSRYGPLNESETEVLKKSKRAKVVFKRRLDAEIAFSSAGKFSIFGPSLVSYRLNYLPTPRKASTPARAATKRNRKDPTSVEENQNEPRKFEFSGAVDANKVEDIAHTSPQSEQLPQLSETSEPERIKIIGKCNMRKSLAWDSAFFTSAGVLDPEELSSMIEGTEKGEKHVLPGIEEDIGRSTDSISTLESDNLTLESLEADFFEDIRASIQKSRKASNVVNSSSMAASGERDTQAMCSLKKAHLASQNRLKPKPASKKPTIGMQGSGKTIKQGSACPQVTQSVVRIGDSTSSLPKPPKIISRANPVSTATAKRASLGANRIKIESENAKSSTVGSKGTQASKAPGLGGPRRVVPKPALSSKSSSLGSSTASKIKSTRPSSSCDSSGSALSDNIGKSPSNSVRRKTDSRTVNPPSSSSILKTPKIVSKNKTPSGSLGLSACLMSSRLSSSISPASSISEWSSESSSSTSTVNQRSNKSRASLDTNSPCRSLDTAATSALDLKKHTSDQISDGHQNHVAGLSSRNIKKASVQTGTLSRPASMKPSGLRMPSPKIGFFDGAKSVVRTPNGGIQSHSGLPTGLPKIGSGACSPIKSSSKAKVGKLPPALTVTRIANSKPNTQKHASPIPFKEQQNVSTKANGTLRSASSSPSMSPEVQNEIGGGSCLKAEEVGTDGRDGAKHGLEAEKNGDPASSKNKMSLDMQGGAGLKDIKIAPIEGVTCDSSSDSCIENIKPSHKVGEDAIYGQHHLKNNLHSLSKTSETETGHFGDQVDGLSRCVEAMDLKLELHKELVGDTNFQFELSCSGFGAPELACSKEHFAHGEKEEYLNNLFTASTRTPFAVKNFCNSEGFDFSTGSSIEIVEKTATLPSSEIGQKENS